MTDNPGHHRPDPGAHHTLGRPRHRVDIAEDFQRLAAAQRAAAADASPTARALIESSAAATYSRLAPLVADLDRTWTPATPPPPPPGPSTLRPPQRDWYTQSKTSPEKNMAATDTVIDIAADTDGTELIPERTSLNASTNRNRIIEIVVKAAHRVRHPLRQRQG